MNYYNENDPKAARWLEELISAGVIPTGVVDGRSIDDVQPEDLVGFTQCHFFAGIGGWAYALQLAGWPEDRPVWTGSCPCQPFSAAGKGKGVSDVRHLWPTWFSLIAVCRPPVVFGEQVASPAGLKWLDLVSTDLEGQGYVVGAADLCAAGVQAPHIRQRLWFVADAVSAGWTEGRAESGSRSTSRSGGADGLAESESLQYDGGRDAGRGRQELADDGGTRGLGDPHLQRSQGRGIGRHGADECPARAASAASEGGMGNTDREREDSSGGLSERAQSFGSGGSFWFSCDWLPCRDGKWRPVEPGTFPLAHGVPARMGRLRGYGNAIVPQVAATFIRAYCDTIKGDA